MSGSTLGKLFTVTSFGESHGPAIGCVVDGCPPGHGAFRSRHPARARPPQARHFAPRDAAARGRPRRDSLRRLRRPHDRHADRAAHPQRRCAAARTTRRSRTCSGRDTPTTRTGRSTAFATTAAAGGSRRARRRCASRPARSRRSGCASSTRSSIRGYMSQLGPIEIPFKSWDGVYENPFFVADPSYVARLEEFMDKLRKSGDSVGAKITTVASNVPVGWGEPVYDKLDADLAYNMMSINAVKGVEIGAGFRGRDAERHRAFGRDDAAGFSLEQRGRHPRRHLDGAGHRRARRGEADFEHPPRRATRSTSTASRRSSRRTAATIRAWASARRRSAKR